MDTPADREHVGAEYAWIGWIVVILGFYMLYLYYERSNHKVWFPFGAFMPF